MAVLYVSFELFLMLYNSIHGVQMSQPPWLSNQDLWLNFFLRTRKLGIHIQLTGQKYV